MISEAAINRTLDRLESGDEAYEQQIQDFAESQPELMEYLTNEDVEAFTEGERELLLFAALVIFQSIDDEQSGLPEVTGDAIATAEERNYEIMAGSKGATLRDRFTPFFEQSEEEELLAFVEDLTLSEEEGDAISPEAREPFFVTLKTVIDTLT
ncbi:hypothetical protein GGR26_003097 [Lewinella marina]|uniref:Uncharacterized protein n=1 Tax=Neolewinella marina TaxID=438751 RepID=A0A2G0CEF9_9BACT|nr:hypothetical protein [Neolewinella marina]NJB87317.1 hypothetical protein [Neolewinella marina]PHK98363.1 hypothetical protein CGL56_11745 [Neolewinella marina]